MFGIGHVLQYAPISLNLNALHFIPLSNTSITQQNSILHKVVFDIRPRSDFNFPQDFTLSLNKIPNGGVAKTSFATPPYILYIVCVENLGTRNRV